MDKQIVLKIVLWVLSFICILTGIFILLTSNTIIFLFCLVILTLVLVIKKIKIVNKIIILSTLIILLLLFINIRFPINSFDVGLATDQTYIMNCKCQGIEKGYLVYQGSYSECVGFPVDCECKKNGNVTLESVDCACFDTRIIKNQHDVSGFSDVISKIYTCE